MNEKEQKRKRKEERKKERKKNNKKIIKVRVLASSITTIPYQKYYKRIIHSIQQSSILKINNIGFA